MSCRVTSRRDYWSILKFNILNKRLTLLFVCFSCSGAGGWNRFLDVLSFVYSCCHMRPRQSSPAALSLIPVDIITNSIFNFVHGHRGWNIVLLGFSMALMGATAVHCDSKWNCRRRENEQREKENIENKLKFMLVWENEMGTEWKITRIGEQQNNDKKTNEKSWL